MNKSNIAILLATYNGEKYLREQIESLYNQTFKDWTIYVHDDGSFDRTLEILGEYEKIKNNFIVLKYPSQKGASNNFFSLLQAVEARYYFFADQDDKWLPNKVEISLREMQKREKEGRPTLICSDAYVTDENLNIVSSSLWKQAGTHPEYLDTFDKAGASPFVTGCTMLINKAAKESVLWKYKEKATMHDAYITLCVLKAKGEVHPIFTPLLYYRQHNGNTLGAYSSQQSNLWYKISHIKTIIKTDYALLKMLQALKYGTLLKFLLYKYKYKKQIKQAKKS